MDDPLQPYRQPLAVLWLLTLPVLVGSLVLAGMICLIVVLARILRVGVDSDRVTAYYRRTVNVFLIGVTLAVAGAAIDMYSNFQSS